MTMTYKRRQIRMVNARTGRPIPDLNTIEGHVNITDLILDRGSDDMLQSDQPVLTGYSVFNPAPIRAIPKEIIMARKPKAESIVNDEGYTETLNPEPVREPTRQEIAAEKAQAKIAAKAEKLEASAAAKAEKEAAKLAKVTSTKEARSASKAERQSRLEALNVDGTRKYIGSMLALADRVKQGVYVKSATGQLRSNDDLAQMLDGVTPNGVIQIAKAVLQLDVNPYSHLNVGQQSMNLRNKLRGALRKGVIELDAIHDYIAENDLDFSESIVEKAAAKAERVAAAKVEREAKAALKAAAKAPETAEA